MKQIGLFVFASLLATVSFAQTATEHTNFSGRWRMLKDQSDFGTFKMPDMVVRVVDQRGETLNLHTVETMNGKTSVSDISYFIDGRESTNNRGGRPATSKAFWDGDALIVRTDTTDSKGNSVNITEQWVLSPDHKTLTTTSDIGKQGGSSVAHLKMVCEAESVK